MRTMVVSEVKQTKICKHIQEMHSKTWGSAILVSVSWNVTIIIKICEKKNRQT